MQYSNQPSFGAPGAPNSPSVRRPKWMPVFIGCSIGCAALFVLLVVLILTAVGRGTMLIPAVDQTARRFMNDIQDGKLDRAYASTSTAMRNSTTLADFKTFVGIWRQQQGAFKNVTLQNSSWFSGTDGTRITLLYDVQGSKRNARVTAVVVTEGKGLAVQSCNFNIQTSIETR